MSNVPPPRPTYPDVDQYDGSDLNGYAVFRTNLRVKFVMDQHYFQTDEARVYYAFGRLKGLASQRVHPWIIAKEESREPYTLNDFYKIMDLHFSDPDRVQRALVRINTMRQGKKSLREFLADFEQTLITAGGLNWSDDQKKALLETAINVDLLRGTVGVFSDSYEGYRNDLLRIEHNLQRVERLTKRNPHFATTGSTSQPLAPKADPEQMDWQPTYAAKIAALEAQIAALRTSSNPSSQRAKWVPEAEIQQRKVSGACIRCGRKGHRIAACTQKPAIRPTQVATTETIDWHQQEIDDESSGKE